MMGPLLHGAAGTVQIAAVAAAIALLSGALAGVARLSRVRVVRMLAGAYIELFRGTSALVQLFYAAFVLPQLGLTLPLFVAGVVVLGLNIGSYTAEVVRGAIQAVPRGQHEAASALGMSHLVALRRVIFPQALLAMVPPTINLMIDLIKTTAFVSLIGLSDLTFQAQNLRIESGGADAPKVFAIVIVIYIVMAQAVAAAGRFLERRLSRGRDVGVHASRSM